MSDPTGQVIKGYEVRELIGAGGFGTVYLAYQPMIGRDVAIKVILPEYANHPNFIRRFEVEAQLVARLEHPHIIPLYDYWREPNSAYLVMRYLRGGSLREALHEKPWDPMDVVTLLDQIAGALTVAHRAGVVHRDLKPDNILLDEDGNAYLADFGIAKDLRAHDDPETDQDSLVGSPAYLSPEQVMGEAVTTQADIYSMGVILYELLGGQHPFPNETTATLLLKHIQTPLPPLLEIVPDIPLEVDDVVQRATAKPPGDRYSNVNELAMALREAFAISDTIQPIGMAVGDPNAIMVAGIPTLISMDDVDIDNPYKGLRPFEEADAADFFGRDDLVGHLIDRLQESGADARFLAVVGPSGSGKSSVVKAGLIPAMRQDALPGSSNWFILEMTPGIQPLEELGTALLSVAINPPPGLIENLYKDEYGLLNMVNVILPHDGSELFLYIDQFEEIFTQTEDSAARVHFLNNLINAINSPHSRLRVVITLRADFYDRPLLYANFGNLVRKRTEVVLPLSLEELGDSIAGPAERVGMALEDGLVGVIVNDVGDEVGALPLLQYALTELFERRQHNILTVSAYESSGGVLGALARRAEEIYTDLDVEQQEGTRQMFLRLVTLGEGTEDTRRRIMWSEVTSIGNIQNIIDLFGKYRLLTFDYDPSTRRPTIEVAHEALIRRWERLREWLQNSREELRLQRRLTHAAEEWLNAGRDKSFLASGVRLAQFEAWASTTDLVMNLEESNYLRASVAERKAQEQLELERQMREAALERRSRNFLRALVVVMFFAAVIASILMVDAINQRQIADEQRVIAENKATEAQSLLLSANARNALNEHDPSLALALALAAEDVHAPPLAETQFILAKTAYGPGVRHHLADFDGSVTGAVFSPDGGHILAGAADHTVRLFDSATGEEVLLFGGEDGGHTDIVNDVAINPDGRYALSGSTDMSARLWDLESGEEIRRFGADGLAHEGVVSVVAFSPDGQTAITGGYDHVIVLWDVESGDEIQRFEGHEGVILDAAFSPDGQFVVSGSADDGPADDPDDLQDRTVRVWDVATGEEIRRFEPGTGFVRAVAFSPDGRYVVSGTWDATFDGTLQLWAMADESENPEPVRRFEGHSDPVTSILFTADGKRIFSGSWDQTVRVWDVATGTEIDSYTGHADRVLQIALSADEQYLLASVGRIDDPRLEDGHDSLPDEKAVWVWDLLGRAQLQLFDDHSDWVWSADLSPDGRYAVSGSGPIRTTSADVDDYSVRVWDLESGEEVLRIDEHENTVNWVDFSPDGTMIASGSWDGTARLWRVDVDAGTWEEAGRFDHGDYQVLTVAFSPDGQTLLTGGSCRARNIQTDNCAQANILLWDVESGEVLRNFEGHTNSVNAVVFDPDGETFISASSDQTLRLWDVASGEELRVFEGHSAGVNNVAFSIDGGQILSSSWDGSVRLWNVETGEEVRQFVGHTGSTWGVAFTVDGLSVLTGGSDTTIRLWSLETGEEIRRFEGHTSWVLSLVFGPEGDFFISGAEDDTMRQWQMAQTTEELMDWARDNRYIRELSCPERELYRVEPLCPGEE